MNEPILGDAVQRSWHRFLDVYEPLLLWWWGTEVRAIAHLELDGERIARLRNYFHAPEVIAEVCRELDVPFRTSGYRYW